MAAIIEVEYYNSYILKNVYTSSETAGFDQAAFITQPQVTFEPVFPGLGMSPDYENWPNVATADESPESKISNSIRNYYVEESRLRGGYNNVSTDLGVRAYLEEEDPIQQHRFNALIYSGIYNSRTGFNATNQFITGEAITRALDPVGGSIQKLYAEDTNLIVFQEDKVNRALIDKDTIYTTEGGTSTLPPGQVIGQITPYLGQYGISQDPESFAQYGFSKYFSDRNRGSIMRLSRDGLTEISTYGMLDYFRDNLAALPIGNFSYTVEAELDAGGGVGTVTSNKIEVITSSIESVMPLGAISVIELGSVLTLFDASGTVLQTVPGQVIRTSINGNNTLVEYSNTFTLPTATPGYKASFESLTNSRIMGGWDIHNKHYVISLQTSPAYVSQDTNSYSTLSFDESINGWVSFFTYKPALMGSLKNKYYTFHLNELYQHYWDRAGIFRGRFYGVDSPSKITFVFNPNASVRKNFKAVSKIGPSSRKVADIDDLSVYMLNLGDVCTFGFLSSGGQLPD